MRRGRLPDGKTVVEREFGKEDDRPTLEIHDLKGREYWKIRYGDRPTTTAHDSANSQSTEPAQKPNSDETETNK